MLSVKKILSACLTSFISFNLLFSNFSVYAENDNNNGEKITEITIYPNEGHKKISPYIYGINDNTDLSDVTVNAVKQQGNLLSSYNWETNYYNTVSEKGNFNKFALEDDFSKDELDTPGIFAYDLMKKADKYDISMTLTTLPMMGYVAADSFGEVKGDNSVVRFLNTSFNKADSYLLVPNKNDDKVYVDEYISYLVSKYNYASNGGFNGYFLDSEPEYWNDRFSILRPDQLTAQELMSKSIQLSMTVKNIDPDAVVFGPSVKNISSYVNLNNSYDWEKYSEKYTWFIDFYLSNFYEAEKQSGRRTLDVLDLHYFTEAYTMVGTPVITGKDTLSNAERIQSVRTLWDSTYTENSSSVLLNKQHTPIIPTVQASIRMYYPDTKLSFSEYSFGGGSNISGGIAQADVLGVFAANDVYMAGLVPDARCSYQKAAINMYTNYDGEGSSFGETLVKSYNGGDIFSSVYSSVSRKSEKTLKSVVINKDVKDKKALISIESPVKFLSASVYAFDENNSDIKLVDKITNIAGNDFEYTLSPLTVYMFEFNGDDVIENTDSNSENPKTEPTESVTQEVNTDTGISESSEIITEVSNNESSLESVDSTVTSVSDIAASDDSDNPKKSVPIFVKIIVSVLVAAVIIIMVYVYFFEWNKNKYKRD